MPGPSQTLAIMAHLWHGVDMPQRDPSYDALRRQYGPYVARHIGVEREEALVVALADGTVFPESIEIDVRVKDENGTAIVTVSLEVRDGRPVVAGVGIWAFDTERMSPAPLSPTMLHGLNFGKVFDEAIQMGAMMGVASSTPLRTLAVVEEAGAAAQRASALARRRQPLTDALLAQVVNIVHNNKYDPRKQVASMFYVSDRTASRWIAEARRRGLLEEGDDLNGGV